MSVVEFGLPNVVKVEDYKRRKKKALVFYCQISFIVDLWGLVSYHPTQQDLVITPPPFFLPFRLSYGSTERLACFSCYYERKILFMLLLFL